MSNLAVASTIKQQLYAFGTVKVWSWGAHAFCGGANFLQFKVQGYLFRGYVRITLNSMDLYDITFSKKKDMSVVVKEINGVYFDNMTDLIDNFVERIPAYKD